MDADFRRRRRTYPEALLVGAGHASLVKEVGPGTSTLFAPGHGRPRTGRYYNGAMVPSGPRSPHPSPRPRAGAVLVATVAGLAIALAPVETPGQAYQYVITFDDVAIRLPDGD